MMIDEWMDKCMDERWRRILAQAAARCAAEGPEHPCAHWTAETWERLRLAREQEERDLRAQIAENQKLDRWLHYQRTQQWAKEEREEAGHGHGSQL